MLSLGAEFPSSMSNPLPSRMYPPPAVSLDSIVMEDSNRKTEKPRGL